MAPPAGLEPATTCIHIFASQARRNSEFGLLATASISQAKPPNLASAALRAAGCRTWKSLARTDKEREQKEQARFAYLPFYWLPLLGSNQRQPD